MTDAAENFARALAEAEDESLETLEAAEEILDRARLRTDAEIEERMVVKRIINRLRWPDAEQADPPDDDR
jgi:hypothetical protein